MNIKDKIKDFDRSQIDEAVYLQDKLQTFTTPFSDLNYATSYFDAYLRKIYRKISNKNAYNRYKENIQYPLSTVNFCETITNAMMKIFQGDGKKITFLPDDQDKDGIPTINWVETDLFKMFVESPNALIFVHKADRYYIDISAVEYILLDSERNVSEICYCAKGKVYYIDSNEIVELDKEYNVLNSEVHKLGLCPVSFISDKLYNYKKPLIRINFFSKFIGEIEELETVGVMENMVNMHTLPYLIESKHKGCDYKNGSIYCEDGFLYSTNENQEPSIVADENNNHSKCPVCNQETGYGSELNINTKNIAGDEINQIIQNIINFKTLDVDQKKYPAERREYLESQIYNKIVNKQESLNNSQQHNEIRVQSSFDSQVNVLFYWKSTIEKIVSDIITYTIKYKNKNYVSTHFSLGTKFFLNSESEYQKMVTESKENGTSDFVDYEIGLIEKKYAYDKQGKDRALFILDLVRNGKPFFDESTDNLISLQEKGIATQDEVRLNMNFLQYINRFETETKTKVNMYNIDKPYQDRIIEILNKIREYGIS